MNIQLDTVNDKLMLIIDEENEKKKLAEQNMLKAKEQMDTNYKLQSKLQDFIV